MGRIEFRPENLRKILRGTAALAALFAAAMFGTFATLPIQTQSQSQSAAVTPRAYTWDVVSVKPSTGAGRGGSSNMPDGFSMHGQVLTGLIFSAYGLKYPEQLVGAPGWLASDKFDVEVKMDSSVMDELDKMSPDDRLAARHQMTQALLADRFK